MSTTRVTIDICSLFFSVSVISPSDYITILTHTTDKVKHLHTNLARVGEAHGKNEYARREANRRQKENLTHSGEALSV
jgi:hypothetical protein